MYRSDDYYRKIIFNEWFEKLDKKYSTMKDGKFCDTRIDIKYAPFVKTFNSVYRKNMRYYDNMMDCYSDCMAVLWEGMLEFEILNESTWEDIANKKDIDNYKKLVTYLNKYVKRTIQKMNRDCKETSKLMYEGNKRWVLHIYYNISTESLNKILTFDNSIEQIELINTIENSFWEKKANYRYGIFAEWVKDNIDKYLTKSQKELLEELKKVNYSSIDDDYDITEFKNSKGQIKLKLERIREKIASKYCEDRKLITGGYVVQDINSEIRAYDKFIKAMNEFDKNEEEYNDDLSHIILNSMNNKYWERLLYEDISNEALKDIIRVYQSDAVVYEDNFKLFNHKTKMNKETICEVLTAVVERIVHLNDAIEYEMSLLKDEANTRNVKVNKMHFEVPTNSKTVYLKISPTGIMIQK